MATDALTMASRETASAIPWETWQRSHLLESAWSVNRFSMIFKAKSINTVDNAGKQVDGMKRPREPPTGGINKSLEEMHEWFIENLFQHRKKVVYALKEITAGDQFEIEIYPQFRSMDEVPPEGRTIKKDNNKAQKNLNDKNARKYVERLINENFSDRDIWMTLTYDDAHLPPDGDVDAAIKNVQKYIRRINYQRKKRGLPNAKYVYVTAYNPDAEIRWHHHIVMQSWRLPYLQQSIFSFGKSLLI